MCYGPVLLSDYFVVERNGSAIRSDSFPFYEVFNGHIVSWERCGNVVEYNIHNYEVNESLLI